MTKTFKEVVEIINSKEQLVTGSIQRTWIDMGAKWAEDTIIITSAFDNSDSYQVSLPSSSYKTQTVTDEKAEQIINEALNFKWCNQSTNVRLVQKKGNSITIGHTSYTLEEAKKIQARAKELHFKFKIMTEVELFS
ncbi:hypothetical protein [Clostridium sp.]|uniref:hypothetical protein n=1 Tax=Clostridium sp. TaxID=1506 RepID=UPI001A616BF7|nr:hypothetical protein [Clostridium sp.]MBK5234077.1 hypothetical protein [Clostridium sp.]